jgi:hypothetical protein
MVAASAGFATPIRYRADLTSHHRDGRCFGDFVLAVPLALPVPPSSWRR